MWALFPTSSMPSCKWQHHDPTLLLSDWILPCGTAGVDDTSTHVGVITVVLLTVHAFIAFRWPATQVRLRRAATAALTGSMPPAGEGAVSRPQFPVLVRVAWRRASRPEPLIHPPLVHS